MAGLLEKRRDDNSREAEVPTSSMADIAFLLLIFFLVTTTINVDTGIGMTLPPELEENQEPPPVKDRNMLKILVNAEGDVLIEEEIASISQVRSEVRKHVLNRGKNPDYSENPDDAVISIKTASETPYNSFINVLDEVWMGYREIWNNEALERGYDSYQAFKSAFAKSQGEDGDASDNPIRDEYPGNVSIAEPDVGGGGGQQSSS